MSGRAEARPAHDSAPFTCGKQVFGGEAENFTDPPHTYEGWWCLPKAFADGMHTTVLSLLKPRPECQHIAGLGASSTPLSQATPGKARSRLREGVHSEEVTMNKTAMNTWHLIQDEAEPLKQDEDDVLDGAEMAKLVHLAEHPELENEDVARARGWQQ